MKKVICLLVSLYLTGCSPKDIAPNENVEALHKRFHGKYKPIISIASEEVDVNLDGKSSLDLFQEYPYLEQYTLQINIFGPNQHQPEPAFLFTQWWPEQYVSIGFSKQWNGEPLAYDPSYYANFAMQGGTHTFSFSADVKQIFVKPNEKEVEHPFRWHLPESVTVEGKEYIRVVNKRRLFTTDGVKDVQIVTLYKRFQTTT